MYGEGLLMDSSYKFRCGLSDVHHHMMISPFLFVVHCILVMLESHIFFRRKGSK